jgi:lysophospholipase L1-like esterase
MQGIKMCLWLLCGLWMETGACQYQTYPFLDLNQNSIKFGHDSTNFMRFLDKMQELKEGRRQRVTIVHIGGSHVQAGFWTEALQDSLQHYAGTEGGGKFLFPYQPIGTNGPPSYTSFTSTNWSVCKCTGKTECPEIGLSGIVLSTVDSSGTVGFVLRPSSGIRQFDSAKIFHNESSSYLLSLEGVAPDEYVYQYNIHGAYTRFLFPPKRDSLVIAFSKIDTSNTPFSLFGLTIEDSRPGVFCASIGVNGATTSSFLKCTAFARQIESLEPDLVIFSLGVNDVQNIHFSADNYIANYDHLVSSIREVKPDCSFLFTTVSDHYRKKKYPNRRTLIANEALSHYCMEKGYALWDLFHVMGGFRSIVLWQRANLAGRDKIHFSASGYRLLARLFFQAIFPQEKRN